MNKNVEITNILLNRDEQNSHRIMFVIHNSVTKTNIPAFTPIVVICELLPVFSFQISVSFLTQIFNYCSFIVLKFMD